MDAFKIPASVPDRLSGWEDDFIVPMQYSESTMLKIHKGELNGVARREIVQAVTHKMLNNCKYPTAKQIQVVATKIVTNINGTRDALGTGHVSDLIDKI